MDEKHTVRCIDYYGDYKLEYPEEIIRLMFIANQIHLEIKEFLRRQGFEYLEISINTFLEVARKHKYTFKISTKGVKVMNLKLNNNQHDNYSIDDRIEPWKENGRKWHLDFQSKTKERKKYIEEFINYLKKIMPNLGEPNWDLKDYISFKRQTGRKYTWLKIHTGIRQHIWLPFYTSKNIFKEIDLKKKLNINVTINKDARKNLDRIDLKINENFNYCSNEFEKFLIKTNEND